MFEKLKSDNHINPQKKTALKFFNCDKTDGLIASVLCTHKLHYFLTKDYPYNIKNGEVMVF